jgi:hypothetical protein
MWMNTQLVRNYAITRNLHVNAGVEWVEFDYAQSPVDPMGMHLDLATTRQT